MGNISNFTNTSLAYEFKLPYPKTGRGLAVSGNEHQMLSGLIKWRKVNTLGEITLWGRWGRVQAYIVSCIGLDLPPFCLDYLNGVESSQTMLYC